MKKQKQDPKVDGVVGSRVGFSSQMVSTKRWKDQKWFLLCLLLTFDDELVRFFFFFISRVGSVHPLNLDMG